MTVPNVLRDALNQFGREAGFVRKSGSWYLPQEDTIGVVELQKSQYGKQYFINVAIWIRCIGEAEYPKEWTCHIRTRFDDLVPADEEQHLKSILDLEDSGLSDDDRSSELLALLRLHLLPLLLECSTKSGLRTTWRTGSLSRFLVTGDAQDVLRG
jgi:hypothetical protein